MERGRGAEERDWQRQGARKHGWGEAKAQPPSAVPKTVGRTPRGASPCDTPSNAQVKAGDRGTASETAPHHHVPSPELVHRQRQHQQQDKETITISAEPAPTR